MTMASLCCRAHQGDCGDQNRPFFDHKNFPQIKKTETPKPNKNVIFQTIWLIESEKPAVSNVVPLFTIAIFEILNLPNPRVHSKNG